MEFTLLLTEINKDDYNSRYRINEPSKLTRY
jgi:hypothetical protein